jgi:hypothetical protein
MATTISHRHFSVSYRGEYGIGCLRCLKLPQRVPEARIFREFLAHYVWVITS